MNNVSEHDWGKAKEICEKASPGDWRGEVMSVAEWTCPHCGQIMHSAWAEREHEQVQCLCCRQWFENPYYESKEGDNDAR